MGIINNTGNIGNNKGYKEYENIPSFLEYGKQYGIFRGDEGGVGDRLEHVPEADTGAEEDVRRPVGDHRLPLGPVPAVQFDRPAAGQQRVTVHGHRRDALRFIDFFRISIY
jgi:hypothetical protein